MAHWTLDDIPWGQFDPTRVDPELVRIIKAAALVEHNGGDYATYLRNVFHDDAEFRAAANGWAMEEVQHGQALGRWAELADPGWSFDAAFKRFTDGFRVPIDVNGSVRGSRTGELIARCIVETGTSSYYTALAAATDEPVLRRLCLKIAADEHRHYKLFYTFMKRYQEQERLGFWGRLRAGLGRMFESEDDELAYAYYAANAGAVPYDRRTYSRAYARRAYATYAPQHIDRVIAMLLKAMGLKPHGRLSAVLSNLAMRLIDMRVRRLVRAGA